MKTSSPMCVLCAEKDPNKIRQRTVHSKQYYVKYCRTCETKLSKEYYASHKEERAEYQNQYRIENKDLIKDKKKKYDKRRYKIKKFEIVERVKSYRSNNKSLINQAKREKRKTSPAYRLRYYISNRIRKILKQSFNKKNDTCLKFLPYSFNELKIHIENQFEPWMTWDNHGVYDPDTWKDSDVLTWVWSLDHIVPQSDLLYTSMKDDNFKKCWSLHNLRPLSAKQNFLDGISRARHGK